ncbi:MAG: iron chelate uptake ABC transporter family permease subunit [Lachnospiraceae bacterium]
MNKKRSFFIIMLLILLLFVSVCSGILFGSVNLSFSDIWAVLTAKDTSSTACVLLKTVRIPRVFGGLFAGVGLACAGVILQGVMNNSLGELHFEHGVSPMDFAVSKLTSWSLFARYWHPAE